ncbi:hypothetical protein HNP38_002525 [Chryseobacterium defluvii]|uniref:Uncharacterized protein n=1 Tax=Chryseobacterium defluvii TaxID=160396 RepID=A0A840KCV6_9FLAO|nr:DUF4262 domain-containing protein [Chryseobacterium defluvii]MBB4807221.1 hypothetical protein [Chryseobacterium defluvii]
MIDEHAQHDQEAKQIILENIGKYGCHLALIEADKFVYTIGLYEKFRYPELICFGLKTDVMASILNYACL